MATMTETGVNMSARRAHRSASGFTLVEVIVAIALLMVVTAAATPLIISGVRLSAEQQRQQVGVIVANEVMENVRGHTNESLSNVEPLVTGRSAAAVSAQFTALADVPGVSETEKASDAHAATASNTPIPIAQTINRDGTDYTVNTVIGTCTQQVSGAGTGSCTKITTTTGRAMVRVIVVVDWSGSEGCTTDGCRYTTSTLINLNRDLEWSDVVS
ncbi:MAG: type IV pilus modification PilV family protein [Pseudoclavibacter sp.]